jgi:hypothetical protein
MTQPVPIVFPALAAVAGRLSLAKACLDQSDFDGDDQEDPVFAADLKSLWDKSTVGRVEAAPKVHAPVAAFLDILFQIANSEFEHSNHERAKRWLSSIKTAIGDFKCDKCESSHKCCGEFNQDEAAVLSYGNCMSLLRNIKKEAEEFTKRSYRKYGGQRTEDRDSLLIPQVEPYTESKHRLSNIQSSVTVGDLIKIRFVVDPDKFVLADVLGVFYQFAHEFFVHVWCGTSGSEWASEARRFQDGYMDFVLYKLLAEDAWTDGVTYPLCANYDTVFHSATVHLHMKRSNSPRNAEGKDAAQRLLKAFQCVDSDAGARKFYALSLQLNASNLSYYYRYQFIKACRIATAKKSDGRFSLSVADYMEILIGDFIDEKISAVDFATSLANQFKTPS